MDSPDILLKMNGGGRVFDVYLEGIREASGGALSPAEIFNALKGTAVTTHGWADLSNSGAGLRYATPAALTLIDDASYPAAENKRSAFTSVINTDTEKFIIVSGDIDLSDGKISDADKSFFDQFNPTTHARLHNDITFNIGSNTTIIGINDARLMFGGLKVSGKSNIIIRNVTFYDAHGSTAYDTVYTEANPGSGLDDKASIDALVVGGASNGIWVDHCRFTDGVCSDLSRNYHHDGAFDIPQGKNITVSWCEFTNHDKVMLVAGGDTLIEPGDRQITLHHNWFHFATQRMPRTRGTQMHLYNNLYDNIGNAGNGGACLGPGINARFLVEHNFFGISGQTGGELSGTFIVNYANQVYPTVSGDPNSGVTFPAIVWSSGNNKAVPRSPLDTGDSKPWEPAYSYSPDETGTLPTAVPAGAGPVLEFER
jgi:pectate lyase